MKHFKKICKRSFGTRVTLLRESQSIKLSFSEKKKKNRMTNDGLLLDAVNKASIVKINMAPLNGPKSLTHLPKRPPANLAFSDLTYKVSEGRKKSK